MAIFCSSCLGPYTAHLLLSSLMLHDSTGSDIKQLEDGLGDGVMVQESLILPLLHIPKRIRIGIHGRGKIVSIYSYNNDSLAVVMYWSFISDLMCKDLPGRSHGSPMVDNDMI